MWKYRNISREEFAIIEWAQLRFGDISLSTLLENPDYNYALKQHERKNIENIKGRFGDVGLIELHNTFRTYSLELTRMAPGVIEDHMATKEASANLTDKHIEQLLNEKIENMDMYSFYNLANRKAGYQHTYYNGVKCDRNLDRYWSNPTTFRRAVELWHWGQAIPIVFAVKTTRPETFVGWGCPHFHPLYDANGGELVTNIILYNLYTRRFRALKNWVTCRYCYDGIFDEISRAALMNLFEALNVRQLFERERKSPILQIGEKWITTSR